MLKAILLDDEPESIHALRLKLEATCPEVEVVWTATDPLLVLRSIGEKDCDVLFLDVEMPELNGFSFLKALPQRSFEVIMVTAYSSYAIQAFKANALGYLLKPVDVDELREAVNKVQAKKTQSTQIDQRLDKLSSILHKQHPGKIALHGAKEIHFVGIDQIVHIVGENNYSTFHLTGGQKIVVTKTLKEYEEALTAQAFFRVHKSHLINLNYIVRLDKGDDSVMMSDGSRIEISTRRKADFLAAIKDL